ncbi:MAG: AMP-binding protein [Anaerolineaceae bacterium]|nr:AMP-binding protein [Anaerolineaceae bacterium]
MEWLFERFERASENPAVIWKDQPYTYGWLTSQILGWQAELDRHSIAQGNVIAIEGDYSPKVIALLLALIERGCIIVPLTTTVESMKPRFKEIAEVQKSFCFGSQESWECIDYNVEVTHPLTSVLVEKNEPGLVLFSSGSTGEPKAALHNFTKLLEKFKVKRYTMRTITFLLLDHIGGINTLLYILSNTGSIIAIEDRSPDAVCAAIEKYEVELLPTSPTFINMLLLSEAYHRFDLSSLRRITYGTEPMAESTLIRLHEIFPEIRLQQTYGLSELGILRSKSRSSDTLWVKVGGEGFETKVVDDILFIRAESAMLGYMNAPSPFDEDGWFNTGDEVIVDGDFIKILGRKSEMINIGGEKVYPAEVESLLLEIDNIVDASVRGEANPITGQMIVARVTLAEPETVPALRKKIRANLKSRTAAYKIPSKVEITNETLHSARFKKMRRIEE